MRTIKNRPYAVRPDGTIAILVGRRKALEKIEAFIALLDKMPRNFKRYGRE